VDESKEVQTEVFNAREIDAKYRAFPPFVEWAQATVDENRWDTYTERMLEKRNETSEEILREAQKIVQRAAAIDTGAIEGLYEVDRGFTLTVAKQTTAWELAINEKGGEVRQLFDAQLGAYDFVLDLVTRKTPVTEAWIRQLHMELCKPQGKYLVQTPSGPQEQELPKGEYKIHSNHVRGRDGELHAYAPVDLTPEEMNRFCGELRGEEFLNAHPVLQASYVHYAFVVIHPFADGNGRVARALASVYTYRSHSVPLLILADTRKEYIDTLVEADRGNFQRFVDFTLERAIDGIQLIEESLQTAESPKAEDALSDLHSLYFTSGGYTHAEIDKAGKSLYEALIQEIESQIKSYSSDEHLGMTIGRTGGSSSRSNDTVYRDLVSGAQEARLTLTSQAPARAIVHRIFLLKVPRDANDQLGPVIRLGEVGDTLHARITEIAPDFSGSLKMRLSIFVERLIAEAIAELSEKAKEALIQQGYY
jgi:Fic family protein